MTDSPRLAIEQMDPGTMDIDQPFNNLVRQIESIVNIQAVSATTTAQPGSPTSGQLYILPASPTGTNWAGKATGTIAYYDSGTWYFETPKGFPVARVADTGALLYWNGTAWANFEILLGAKGADIASAATTNLSTATGQYVHVTGTTTITALGTARAGIRRSVVFDGALILTHNATSLILPGGANVTTAAGDSAEFMSEGSGNWRCINYTRAASAP